MQTIIRIAKTELRTLFYSPIAWFLLIVFMVQCGIVYFTSLSRIAVHQEIGGYGLKSLNSLTSIVFLGGRGVFISVMQNLYLYVPLLTMSLISRETGSGTIKLLYSSPIDVSEIIFGKFLAMMVYSLLLLGVVCIFVISGTFHIQHVEKGMLLTGLLGFFLLLCTYSSIGLFMSCLTTYQVVAAICTFVMIGILSYIGSLWQDIELVRELTYFLSISGRTRNMLSGLLTTKDVLYFLLIIYMFLGFSIFKLKAGMESKPAAVRAARYIAIFASVLLIGYISSRPGLVGYYDATSNKSRTLTPQVQKIVSELEGAPLEITVYNNLLGGYWFLGTPESYTENLARWEEYTRFKPDIEVNTIMYYDSVLDAPYLLSGYPDKSIKQIAEQKAKSSGLKMSLFKTPEEIRKRIDLTPEMNRYVMQLKWKDKTTFLRVFDDQIIWPTEPEVAAAMKRLLGAKLPKIYFLTGHLERDINKVGDRDYKTVTTLKTFRYSLLNQGFDIDTLSLDSRDIPSDISVLVVADPKVQLSAAVSEKISKYIDSGGNLILSGEPGKQSILNPLLKQLGVKMMEGTALQQSKEYAPDLLVPDITPAAGKFYHPLEKRLADNAKVSMSGAAGLEYSDSVGFIIQPLLISDHKLSWNRVKPLDPDVTNASVKGATGMATYTSVSNSASNPSRESKVGTVLFSPEDGDIRGPITTAISLTRKLKDREQRIIVTGDADFMSNSGLQRYISNAVTANFIFSTAMFSWLNYGEYPVDATRPDSKDKRVNVNTDNIGYLKVIYIWIAPALLLALAAIILIRRKRK